MLYRVLLETMIAAHFAFILFIVFGALLAFRWRWTIFFHLPTVAYGLLIELLNVNCPLEPLEMWLRDLSFESGFTTGFLEPYLIGLIYPPGWNQSFGNLMAALLFGFNLLVYSFIFLRRRRRIA